MRRHARIDRLLAVVAALAGLAITAASGGGLPRDVARLPADPAPGVLLSPVRAEEEWIVLDCLDAAAGFLTGRRERDGREIAVRLLPYTSLWRFGAPGAAAEDYQAGDRLLLTLGRVRVGRRELGPYAFALRDEISEQVRTGRCYRMESQDRARYRFTVQPIRAESGEPDGEPLTLDYGADTFLVLAEEPIYIFNVPAGTRLWMNTGFRTSTAARQARHTLDAASLDRYRQQQRLRTIARLDAAGAPAYAIRGEGGRARFRCFPDAAAWLAQRQPGDAILIRLDEGGSFPGVVAAVHAGEGIEVDPIGAAPVALPEQRLVRLLFRRTAVSYVRDIRPLLAVNCLACHNDRRADSGFSVASIPRMLAGGRRGPAIVPGRADQSLLYLTMASQRAPRMPPDREPTPEQLALVKAWIDAGACDDEAKPPP